MYPGTGPPHPCENALMYLCGYSDVYLCECVDMYLRLHSNVSIGRHGSEKWEESLAFHWKCKLAAIVHSCGFLHDCAPPRSTGNVDWWWSCLRRQYVLIKCDQWGRWFAILGFASCPILWYVRITHIWLLWRETHSFSKKSYSMSMNEKRQTTRDSGRLYYAWLIELKISERKYWRTTRSERNLCSEAKTIIAAQMTNALAHIRT